MNFTILSLGQLYIPGLLFKYFRTSKHLSVLSFFQVMHAHHNQRNLQLPDTKIWFHASDYYANLGMAKLLYMTKLCLNLWHFHISLTSEA